MEEAAEAERGLPALVMLSTSIIVFLLNLCGCFLPEKIHNANSTHLEDLNHTITVNV